MNATTQTTSKCPGCGKKKKLKEFAELQLCASCSRLASALQNEPEQLERITQLLDANTDQCPTDMPEVLDAVRYRAHDRERNTWYVSVSEIEGEPVEMFASTAFDRYQHLQSRISNLTTITRLISLILRHISLGEKLTLEKTITQLHRSSRQPNDLPEMLVRILSKYSKKPEHIFKHEHETP